MGHSFYIYLTRGAARPLAPLPVTLLSGGSTGLKGHQNINKILLSTSPIQTPVCVFISAGNFVQSSSGLKILHFLVVCMAVLVSQLRSKCTVLSENPAHSLQQGCSIRRSRSTSRPRKYCG